MLAVSIEDRQIARRAGLMMANWDCEAFGGIMAD